MDLLTAELAKKRGIELVERDQLRLLLKEFKLTDALGAVDVQTRLRIGKLLKADALVILSRDSRTVAIPERPPGGQGSAAEVRRATTGTGTGKVQEEVRDFVKVVISDCRHGARQ
ncbi:unnamed protein product, partial [marine sediment metagenome]